MITKYYSEKTKKYYSTKEDCVAAEKEYDSAHEAEIKEREARKKDADKVQEAYNALVAARKAYEDAVSDFTNKHSGYRITISSGDFFKNFYNDLLDLF